MLRRLPPQYIPKTVFISMHGKFINKRRFLSFTKSIQEVQYTIFTRQMQGSFFPSKAALKWKRAKKQALAASGIAHLPLAE